MVSLTVYISISYGLNKSFPVITLFKSESLKTAISLVSFILKYKKTKKVTVANNIYPHRFMPIRRPIIDALRQSPIRLG